MVVVSFLPLTPVCVSVLRWRAHGRRTDPTSGYCKLKSGYTPAFRSVSLEGLRILIDMLGPPTFGILRLLAHWASRTDVKVPEDELLAELRSVGADEWEEAGTEAERSVEELARLRSSRTEG